MSVIGRYHILYFAILLCPLPCGFNRGFLQENLCIGEKQGFPRILVWIDLLVVVGTYYNSLIYDRLRWHAYFRMSCTNNYINVLESSHLCSNLEQYIASPVPYIIQEKEDNIRCRKTILLHKNKLVEKM